MTKEIDKFEALHSKSDYALATLASRQEQFSLVFLDPPYREENVEEDIRSLVEKGLLADVAVIVCEVGKKAELPEIIEGIERWDERDYRNTKIVIYQKEV